MKDVDKFFNIIIVLLFIVWDFVVFVEGCLILVVFGYIYVFYICNVMCVDNLNYCC